MNHDGGGGGRGGESGEMGGGWGRGDGIRWNMGRCPLQTPPARDHLHTTTAQGPRKTLCLSAAVGQFFFEKGAGDIDLCFRCF